MSDIATLVAHCQSGTGCMTELEDYPDQYVYMYGSVPALCTRAAATTRLKAKQAILAGGAVSGLP